ncbi:MAG: HDOD domain-containing protein [Thermodesulfobacteriota bacterium]
MVNPMDLPEKVKFPPHLASLPQVILKLVEACQDPDVGIKDLSNLIAKDPSLSAKVLRLVNSAYAGLAEKVTSLEKAVVFLGIDTIKNIALTASVLETFSQTKGGPQFNLNCFWWHSFFCACLAKRIAELIGYPSLEEAFLAGLLHDVGKLVLQANFGGQYASLLKEHPDDAELAAAEKAEVGCTHAEVGAELVNRWKLRSFLADALRYHHEEAERLQDAFDLLKIVYVANALSQEAETESESALAKARIVFDFTPILCRDLKAGVMEEVNRTAKSFDIAVEPPPGPEAATAEPRADKRQELLLEVKNNSLLVGTLQALMKAESPEDIVQMIHRGLDILFEVNRVMVFICRQEQKALIASAPPGAFNQELVNSLRLPLASPANLPIKCLLKNQPFDSLGLTGEQKLSIADEQIIRLLEAEGILCLPLLARKRPVGVIVLGLGRAEARAIWSQRRLLELFISQAAMGLHLHELKRAHARRIIQERQEVTEAVARVMVHEVNNPLGIIKNYLSILGRKLPPEDPAQDELRIISEEVDRVGQIVQRLTSYAGPACGRAEPIDVNKLLNDILKIMSKSILRPAGIEAHLDLDPALPLTVVDRNSLVQAVINLIKNAAEAMTGGGDIHIRTRRAEPAADLISITIRDEGPGLPEAIRANIFEPGRTTKNGGHVGLGLSIVNSLVKEMNGRIAWESRPRSGTAFTITLPVSSRPAVG